MAHGRAGRHGHGLAALCLFLTSLIGGALGALMAVSTSPWYAPYAAMGMTPCGLSPGRGPAARRARHVDTGRRLPRRRRARLPLVLAEGQRGGSCRPSGISPSSSPARSSASSRSAASRTLPTGATKPPTSAARREAMTGGNVKARRARLRQIWLRRLPHREGRAAGERHGRPADGRGRRARHHRRPAREQARQSRAVDPGPAEGLARDRHARISASPSATRATSPPSSTPGHDPLPPGADAPRRSHRVARRDDLGLGRGSQCRPRHRRRHAEGGRPARRRQAPARPRFLARPPASSTWR